MSRDAFQRWGWLLALSAGMGWVIGLTLNRVSPDSNSWDCNSSWDYVANGFEPIVFLLTGGAAWALYVAQRDHRYARYLRWSAVAAAAGSIGAAINNPIEHCAHVEVLGLVLWVPSSLLWVLGLLFVGVLTMTDHQLPRWAGLAVVAGVAGLFAGGEEDVGFAIHAASWFFVALALWLNQRGQQYRRDPGRDCRPT